MPATLRGTPLPRHSEAVNWDLLKPLKKGEANPAWCHLCGLPIPDNIVSQAHPLFGTIDHIVPLSRNGTNSASNLGPAHRLCNGRKGNVIVDPEGFGAELRPQIALLLKAIGHRVTRQQLKAANRRVTCGWPGGASKLKAEDHRVAFDRWADDGGSVLYDARLDAEATTINGLGS